MNLFTRVLIVVMIAALVVGICGQGLAGEAKARSADDVAKAAVAFLKKSQNEDGMIGKLGADVGITSLAVYGVAKSPLAGSGDGKQVIAKGVKYILSQVQDDGSINNDPKLLSVYRTSLAMMALTAVDPAKYKGVIKKAQDYLKAAQFGEKNGGFTPQDWQYGGWGYSDKPADQGKIQPDLSNLQFALSALKESGLPADDPAYKNAIIFLQRCQNRTESNDRPTAGNDGGAFYAPMESKAGPVKLPDGTMVYKSYGSMTYALLKGFAFCGLPKDDPRIQAAYTWITQNYSVDETPGMGQMGLFYYFMTMANTLNVLNVDAVKTADGRSHDWRKELIQKIGSLQNEDGSWSNKQDRWMESDPVLVTGYALTVLDFCKK